VEIKFTKSRTNKGTENVGLALLLTDERFQAVDMATKRRILEIVGTSTSYGIQTFDAVMVPSGTPQITTENVERYFATLRLVEMKTTRKPIKDAGLAGFFFGATEREYAMAKALGERYLFAFIVLNNANVYGAPFAALLTLEEVEARTRAKRIQYQVNFRSDLSAAEATDTAIVFGTTQHIPRSEPL
jgi:hypothetical protein